jgi:peptide/nickel transport system permease protein
MSIAKTLAIRGLTLVGVLFAVLVMVVVTLGATGFSDRMLTAIVNEEVRGLRQGLAQTIRNVDEIEQAIQEHREELEASYGLNRPWYYRLPQMIGRVVSLDLGKARTLKTAEGSSSITSLIGERLPRTMLLVTTASVMTAIFGLFFGVKLATRVGSRSDRIASLFAATSNALPAWWAGILMILLTYIILSAFNVRIFPPGGMYSAPPPEGGLARLWDLLWHATLPVITMVLISAGSWTYVVRTMVINTAQEDFVTVARAKGLPEGTVMRNHILRVAAPPILTGLILGLASSVGGAILTETVFNWPGMGRLYYDAILSADETVVVALTFMFTLIYVTARFTLEVLYIIVDPRVRYS